MNLSEWNSARARLRAVKGAKIRVLGVNEPAATKAQEIMGAALFDAVSSARVDSETENLFDEASGKKRFQWGVDGFTPDELANDRWRMT